jgi:hypothetical protein
MRAPLAALLICAALATPAAADEWPTPTETFLKSDNGRYRARLVPRWEQGKGTITLYDDQNPTAPRKVYDRRLVNKVAPVLTYLTNTGQLVTLDEWHHAGYDHALVVYDRRGRLIMDCHLDQLLLPTEKADVQQSVSSRWYRADPNPIWLDQPQTTIHIKTSWGPTMSFDLATGTQTRDGANVKIPGAAKCRPRR